MLEIIASLWRENPSRNLKTELFARVLELCSRSEILSWSSVWIEFRESSFTRIDVDESFKCRTEYRILKYEHVKKYAFNGVKNKSYRELIVYTTLGYMVLRSRRIGETSLIN